MTGRLALPERGAASRRLGTLIWAKLDHPHSDPVGRADATTSVSDARIALTLSLGYPCDRNGLRTDIHAHIVDDQLVVDPIPRAT